MTTSGLRSGTAQISPGTAVVTVIERFAPAAGPLVEDMTTVTDPPAAGASSPVDLAAATTRLEQELSKTDGFVAGVLLAGQQGEVVLYSQWETTAKVGSLAPALPELARIDGRTFAVDFTAPGPLSEVSLTGSPRAHFGVFTVAPENQEKLLERAREYAPKSLGTPGLLAVNFHRSLDGHRVLNFGLWSDFDGFGKLESRPGFSSGGKYWQGIAGFRPHYFDVAAVVAR